MASPLDKLPRKLLIQCRLAYGDILMLTAAIRDLRRATGDRFELAVSTTYPELWEHNPNVVKMRRDDRDFKTIIAHYPLFRESNARPYHFLHGFSRYLGRQLGIEIPVTEYRADLHFTAEELARSPVAEKTGYAGPYWVLMAGGKDDITTKWWDPDFYQRLVKLLEGRVLFAQCGQRGSFYSENVQCRLQGVLDMVNKTGVREFALAVYHSLGVVCPVTAAMHLAAAVPEHPLHPGLKPCVVIAGGRESPSWEAYPGHQFLHTVGQLDCCRRGGCWRRLCQSSHPLAANDPLGCAQPIQVRPDLRIPRCMRMITPERVAEAVNGYYEGGVLTPIR